MKCTVGLTPDKRIGSTILRLLGRVITRQVFSLNIPQWWLLRGIMVCKNVGFYLLLVSLLFFIIMCFWYSIKMSPSEQVTNLDATTQHKYSPTCAKSLHTAKKFQHWRFYRRPFVRGADFRNISYWIFGG